MSPRGSPRKRLHLRVVDAPGWHRGTAPHHRALRTDSGGTVQALRHGFGRARDPDATREFPRPAEKARRRIRLRPPLAAVSLPCYGTGRAREPPLGSHRPPPPQRPRPGPAISELRLGCNGFTGIGIAGMVRDARDLGGDHEAHGRNERQVAGNGDMTQRTRQRSNALKSAASRDSDELSRHPTSVGTGDAHGASAASATEPPRLPLREVPRRCPRCDPRE
jgi:hypothetical protein